MNKELHIYIIYMSPIIVLIFEPVTAIDDSMIVVLRSILVVWLHIISIKSRTAPPSVKSITTMTD